MASVIDIFCGAGGLTRGFLDIGFPVVVGIDSDVTCRYAYQTNNHGVQFIHSRLEDVTADQIDSHFIANEAKIIVGCAPCQPFSSYTRRYQGTEDIFRDKWDLVRIFGDRINSIRPHIISMENVPALLRSDVYAEFKETLANAGYHFYEKVVYAPDYGVPQTRKRLVVLASLFGEITLIPPTHTPEEYPTVEQTIGALQPLQAGEVDDNDSLHRTRRLSQLNLKRIQQSIPGGTWEDWDDDLLAGCHQRSTGKTYQSVYGRMRGDEPAPTITTQAYSFGSGRFGHYDVNQNRALSLREIALLQTFPQHYEFVDPRVGDYSLQRISRHLGNAVPVRLAQAIARSIQLHLNKFQMI